MKKFFVLCLMTTVIQSIITAQTPAMPVFDPTNWLVAIDTLYSTYDQVMNTVEQIENQYKQMEQAVKAVASWKLDEVEWDGDLDFRNEIKSVTNSVNKQISNIKSIEDSLTTKQIKIGNYSGTIADLVNPSGANNLITAVEEVWAWGKNDVWSTAAAGFAGKLTDKQKSAIASKYGLSPENYFYVQTKKKQLNQAIEKASLLGEAEAYKLKAENLAEELQAVLDMSQEEGVTVTALNQGLLIMTRSLINQVQNLEKAFREAAALTAAKTASEIAEKEAKEAEIARLKQEIVVDVHDFLFMGNVPEKSNYSGDKI